METSLLGKHQDGQKGEGKKPFPPMCDGRPTDLPVESGNGGLECCSALCFQDRAVTSRC